MYQNLKSNREGYIMSINKTVKRNLPIAKQILGRVHVSCSNRTAIKEVIKGMSQKYKTWRTLGINQRKGLMKAFIKAHRENQKLYFLVNSGMI